MSQFKQEKRIKFDLELLAFALIVCVFVSEIRTHEFWGGVIRALLLLAAASALVLIVCNFKIARRG